jgi:2-polyprenyl-3-methyl-5-hydroxy-6-metoxy-1,4-benzoquinol methylase
MKLETERDADEMLNAAKAIAVVSAWSELGLFDRLREGPVRREGLGVDARALAVTLPVLAHLGVIATDGTRVSLTPAGERLVRERAMPTSRNLVSLRDLSRMTDVLRDGGPVKDDEGRSKATRGGTTSNPVETERFLDMLYRLSEGPAKQTYTWLAPGLPQKASVLDLGGGHGRYARAFADAGHAVTVFDQPEVVALAKKRHGDALAYVAGNFHEVEGFGGPWDLVLMCNIVHGESAGQNASLIARAAKSLRPGGRVAIRDWFLDEHGSDPKHAVFFGLTMLFYTEQGTSPSVRDARAWLEQAGLVGFELLAVDTQQLAVARKS